MIRFLGLGLLILNAFIVPVAGAEGQRAISVATIRAGHCPTPPNLALLPGFEDPRGAFAPEGRAFRSFAGRFAEAYRRACESRRLLGSFVPPGATDPDWLFLKNGPNLHSPWIHREGDLDSRAPPGPMIVEFPFVRGQGSPNVPSVRALELAIICSAWHAASNPGPIEDFLECLPD